MSSTNPSSARSTLVAFISVTTLFFMWGFITSMNDPLIPAVRAIFKLNYAESLLTQFAFFIAYAIVSMPGGTLVVKMGYGPSIVLALVTMIIGCLCMPLATWIDSYAVVLLALFVIASGITVLQVAANPLSAALGSVESSHFRLTLSQAFNSLGTVFGPWLGSTIMLHGGMFGETGTAAASRSATFRQIDLAYVLMAVFLALLMLFILSMRARFRTAHAQDVAQTSVLTAFKSKWAVLGAVAIFFY